MAPRPRGVALLLGAFHSLAFADRFLIAPLAGPIEHTLKLDDAGFGAAIGPALILPYIVGVYLLGRRLVPEQVGRWASWSLLLCALAGVVGAASNGVGLFLFSRVLLGLGEAGFDAAALLLLAGAPPDRRGAAFGLFTAGALIGKAVALSGGGLLLGAFAALMHAHPAAPEAWRLVLLSFALVTAAAGLVRLTGFEPSGGDLGEDASGGADKAVGGSAWTRLGLTIPMGAGVFASQAFTAFAALALARRYHLSPAHAGEVLGAVLLVVGVTGSQIGGQIAARTRRPGGVALAAPLLAAALAGGGLLMSATLPQAVSCMAAIVLALSVLAPLGLDHLQRSTPRAQRSRVLSGYLSTATLFAFGVGPTAVGFLSVRFQGPGAAQTAICLVVMAAALVGAASAVALRRPA